MRNPANLLYSSGVSPKVGLVAGDVFVTGYSCKYVTRVEDDLAYRGLPPMGVVAGMSDKELPLSAVNIFVVPVLSVKVSVYAIPTGGSHVGDYPAVFSGIAAPGYSNQRLNAPTIGVDQLAQVIGGGGYYFRGNVDTQSSLGVQPSFGSFIFPDPNALWADARPGDAIATNDVFTDLVVGWTMSQVTQVFRYNEFMPQVGDKHWWVDFVATAVPATCALLPGCPVWTNNPERFRSYSGKPGE